VIIGSGTFYGGMKYEASKAKTSQKAGWGDFGNGAAERAGAKNNQNGPKIGTGSAASSGFINGSITSKDDKSITVKGQDGSSKIIFFSDTTTIGKATTGSSSDLASGQQVMVSGKTNSDGSVTAQNIQIRPTDQQQDSQVQ
jgi:hypothetical protein